MARAPIYNIGQTVYLAESAALGFLEAYIIKEIAYQPSGKIVYTLATSLKQPSAVQTIGDRVTGQRALPIKFYEEDLIGYEQALDACIANLQNQLTALQRLRQGLT
ncbi:MAG: hypothetical protein WC919_01475 [Candidatus Paceibacterota bacterium]|jgi:hypothetical protein